MAVRDSEERERERESEERKKASLLASLSDETVHESKSFKEHYERGNYLGGGSFGEVYE
ncbi:hypothetical protein KIPB_008031, partial [Kipferlia bialata]|eukprot:g8031.t1